MANFDLNQYETVDERLRRLYADHPHARILTHNLTTEQDRQAATWVVKAELWLPLWTLTDAPVNLLEGNDGWYLKATGMAFEVDGQGMANKTSALENCETSSIGRCLANAGWSGNKKNGASPRPSREEMEKVARADVQPDWLAEAKATADLDKLKSLWQQARKGGAPASVLSEIERRASELTDSKDSAGSNSGS
jgi:hypothetical protein